MPLCMCGFGEGTRAGETAPFLALARIIHEDFYCNRRYAAQSVNILFKYASLLHGSTRPSRVASRRFRHELS